MSGGLFTPRLRPLSPRKGQVYSVLDIGTSKIACLVARLAPAEPTQRLPGRTHFCRVLGIGHQQSRGMKGGEVGDLAAVENSIRHALDAAERMAGVEIERVIVNISGGRLGSAYYSAKVNVRGRAIVDSDLRRALEAAAARAATPGRAVLHALPTSYSLDATPAIVDPRGMLGEELGADMHVASCNEATARHVMLAVERCGLEIDGVVASPYASGLAVLVDDETTLGATVVDMGGGTTTIGMFQDGRLVNVDGFAVGGLHVTTDIARGLNVRQSDAERLKALYGSCLTSTSDERETLSLARNGEDGEHPHQVPRAQLTRIIRPRVEEILEIVRDKLAKVGFGAQTGRQVVLTGGASQLTGLVDMARRIVSPHARIGRPMGVHGLPEAAKNPAFASAIGLLVYPQFAGVEFFEPRYHEALRATGTDSYLRRLGYWLKESF